MIKRLKRIGILILGLPVTLLIHYNLGSENKKHLFQHVLCGLIFGFGLTAFRSKPTFLVIPLFLGLIISAVLSIVDALKILRKED